MTWLSADWTASSAVDIDYLALRERGVRALLFDLDRTLGPRRARHLPERAQHLLASLASEGFRIGILSNRRRPKNDPVIEQLAERHALLHTAGKPRRRGYLALLERLDATASEAAMIGDKWITDILGAKRLGMFAIRVRRPIRD